MPTWSYYSLCNYIILPTVLFVLTVHSVFGATISGNVYFEDEVTKVTTGDNNAIIVYSGENCSSNTYVGRYFLDTSNGTYSINDLPAGRYYLKAKIPEHNVLDQWWGNNYGTYDCSESGAITIESSDNISNIDFILQPGASISGSVFTANGGLLLTSPQYAFQVAMFKASPCSLNRPSSSYAMTPSFASSDSTSNGKYSISKLPPGTYYLTTDIHPYIPNGYSTKYSVNYLDEWWASNLSTRDCSLAEPIVLGSGETLTDIDFQLDEAATVSGKIYHNDGQTPVVNSYVPVHAVSGSPCGSHTSVSEGHIEGTNNTYLIMALDEGSYYFKIATEWGPYVNMWWTPTGSSIDCREAQAVSFELGESKLNINFQLNTGNVVSGTLFMDDGATPFTSQYPRNVKAYQDFSCGNNKPARIGIVDKVTGGYMIEGLLPGSYYLQADDDYKTIGVIFSGGYSGGQGAAVQEILIDETVNEWWAASNSTTDCADAKMLTFSELENRTDINFQLGPWTEIEGDVDLDGKTSLDDAIISMQMMTGKSTHSVWRYGDTNGDKKIDITDVISILNLASEQ